MISFCPSSLPAHAPRRLRDALFKRPVLISAALTLAFVTWLWQTGWLARWQEPLQRVSLSLWLALALGLLISYGLRAWRIQREFSDTLGMHWLLSLRIVLIHTALVNLMPMRSGELGFPWLMKRALNVQWLDASASLMWLRLQDACVLSTLSIWVWPGWSWPLRMVLTFLLWSGVYGGVRWIRHHGGLDHGTTPGKVAQLTRALNTRGRRMTQGWLISTTNWALKLSLQAWLLAQMLNANMASGWAGSLGAELSALLPVQGLGGIGTYEAGSATAMRWHGVPWDAGLQVALTLHVSLLLCSISYGLLAWWFPRPMTYRHNQNRIKR
jgi:hypothetical protein